MHALHFQYALVLEQFFIMLDLAPPLKKPLVMPRFMGIYGD